MKKPKIRHKKEKKAKITPKIVEVKTSWWNKLFTKIHNVTHKE